MDTWGHIVTYVNANKTRNKDWMPTAGSALIMDKKRRSTNNKSMKKKLKHKNKQQRKNISAVNVGNILKMLGNLLQVIRSAIELIQYTISLF